MPHPSQRPWRVLAVEDHGVMQPHFIVICDGPVDEADRLFLEDAIRSRQPMAHRAVPESRGAVGAAQREVDRMREENIL